MRSHLIFEGLHACHLLGIYWKTSPISRTWERTVRRWLDQPDGLPYTRAGCRILIHVPTAREWLMSNLKRRNPRRPA
jgi:hypothetical protein